MNKNVDKKMSAVGYSLLGILATAALYILLVFAGGVIAGGDIGSLDTEIPGMSLLAPLIMVIYSTLTAYFTKRYGKKVLFYSIFCTLCVPVVTPFILMLIPPGPLMYLIFLAIPGTSLFYGFFMALEDLGVPEVVAVALGAVFGIAMVVSGIMTYQSTATKEEYIEE